MEDEAEDKHKFDGGFDSYRVETEFGRLKSAARSGKNLNKKTGHINYCYLLSLLLTICIGTVQFGWSIGQWNSGWLPYAKSIGIFKGLDEN